MIRRFLVLVAVISSLVGGVSGQIDSRTAYRVRYGAALPAACNPNTGDVFFRTATNIGLHHCTASNTWTFISVVGGVGTFTTINLTASTNQIVLDSDAANTGTITMAALTGARIWTLQDGTGTLYQTGGTDVSLADGGTNASLTASNGGIFYSTASAGAILAGTATANQMLQSGASTTPAWSTATWPATTTINQLLYSSAASTVAGLATANSGLLVTGATGVPSIGTDIPTAVTIGTAYIYRVGGTDVSVADGGTGLSTFGGANTVLFTTAADALSSIATANNGVLITSGTGVPSISSTIPTATQDNITRVGTVVSGTWTATDIALADGGTNASLTASNGGIFYSTASAGAILAGTATAGQILRSGASAAPAWSTATYPAAVGAASTILRSDGTNFVSTTTTLENTTGNIATLDGTGTFSGARTMSATGTALTVTNNTTTGSLTSTGNILGTGTGLSLGFTVNDGTRYGAMFADSTNAAVTLGTWTNVPLRIVQDGNLIATVASTGVTINGTLTVSGTNLNVRGVTYAWPSADGTSGQQLQTDGAGVLSWAAASSERWMKNIIRQWNDPVTALNAVLATPVYDFTYLKGYGTQDSYTIYTGVMADEAPWAMDHFGKQLTGISTFGYTVLSIKALHAKITSLELEVASLKARLN